MDINNIEKRLKKIHTVLEVFKEDNKISSIERDLLLGYVRELYDLIKETNEIVKDDIILHPLESKKVQIDNSKVQTQIIPEEIEKKYSEKIEEETKIKNKSEEKINVINKIEQKQKTQNINVDIDIIFEEDKAQDLSEKLSMTKISDIGKMGINERMHLVKELFKNDNNLFLEFVQVLNNLNNYEEAKKILIKTAEEKNWIASEEKIKAAQQFVKQVRRRFL